MNATRELPLFPLNLVLFPGMVIPLHIFEERYKLMIAECIEYERPFGIVLIRSGSEVGAPTVPHNVGTLAVIQHVDRLEHGRMNIVVRGRERFRIEEISRQTPYLSGRVAPLEDEAVDGGRLRELLDETRAIFEVCLTLRLTLTEQWISQRELPQDPAEFSFIVAARMGGTVLERQELLEMTSVEARLREERAILQRERVKLQKQLTQKLRRQEKRGGSAVAAF